VPRPRLPLTAFEREKAYAARKVGVIVLVAGLAVAAVAAALGDVRAAVVSSAVAVLFLVAAATGPLRLLWLTVLLYALIPVLVGSAFGHPVIGALVGAVVAGGALLNAVRGLRAVADTLRPLEIATVDPEAAGHVAAFEALGFEQVGAYAFDPVPGKTVVATVMLGPRRDEYAVVTDLVLDVISTFGPRWLLTRNSASAPLPPEYLSSDLRGAEPNELVDAHRRALEILGARGLKPDAISREHLLETQLSSERRCTEWALLGPRARAAKALLDSGVGEGELDEGPSSARRIDAWLGVAGAAV
jgi:hypothetical protein